MGMLPEPRRAKHGHAAPNRWIADFERLPGGRPVLEKALHDGADSNTQREKRRLVVDPVLPGAGETSVERRAMPGRGAVMTAALSARLTEPG